MILVTKFSERKVSARRATLSPDPSPTSGRGEQAAQAISPRPLAGEGARRAGEGGLLWRGARRVSILVHDFIIRKISNNVPHSAIAGIGLDMVYLDRIDRALARFGVRFAVKILGADELSVFQRRRARDPQRGVRYLATRFAAKEAFSKAIGLGMHAPMWWTRAQVLNAASGQPLIVLSEPLQSWYAARFGAVHVSLTDERDLAAAYVVVERIPSAAV